MSALFLGGYFYRQCGQYGLDGRYGDGIFGDFLKIFGEIFGGYWGFLYFCKCQDVVGMARFYQADLLDKNGGVTRFFYAIVSSLLCILSLLSFLLLKTKSSIVIFTALS